VRLWQAVDGAGVIANARRAPQFARAPPATPDKERPTDQAKEQLTNNRLAFPPDDDITIHNRSN
jgi:hypothetical protein